MNQNVLITGASRGLGLSLSRAFLKGGDFVIGVSKTKKYWNQALRDVSDTGKFQLHQLDITSEISVRTFISKLLQKIKRIDILINNAGYGGELSDIQNLLLKEFEKHLRINLISQFLMAKYLIPHFRNQKKGFVINISSMAGKRAVPHLSAYSASKFGVIALSQCIAKENADTGLKSIAVCPGGMNTEMRAQIFGREDAETQQSTDFVAQVVMDIVDHKIEVQSGGDIVIRHGKVTQINPSPQA